MRNIFESSCTEEGTVAGKDIFEVGFNFAASEARKKSESTISEVQIEEYSYAYQSTQIIKLEGKLKHDFTGEQSGSDWGVIAPVIFLNGMLMV